MFKNILAITSLLLVLIIGFQNCAQEGAFESQRTHSVEFHSIDQGGLTSPHPLDNIKPKIEATTYEPILADRYYLKSLMTDIFGPSTASVDTRKIFVNAIDFSSACTPNESYTLPPTTTGGTRPVANNMENSVYSSTNRLVPTTLAQATTIRQALLTRSCSDWTHNATTLRYALKKISSSAVPEPSDENLLKAYKLFYRGKADPHQGLIDALKILATSDAGKATENTWKSVIYSICTSSYWQVL